MAFSVVLITKNEEHNITRCLDSIQGLTDDVVVIDDGSVDATVQLAKERGARVYIEDWKSFAENKNIGNQKAKYPWILSLDADEMVSPELALDILSCTLDDPKQVFMLDRLNSLAGTWIRYSGWYPDRKPRLFHRDYCRWEGAYVHEELSCPKDVVYTNLKGKLYHFSHRTIDEYRDTKTRYAKLKAEQRAARGKKPNKLGAMLSAAFRIPQTLILKGGVLDGYKGWVIARENARAVMTRYNHLRYLNGREE